MRRAEPDTDQLLTAAGDGDARARGRLLDRHRERLCRMIAVRLDRRLAARVDPSDVAQEALAEADRRLDEFLRDRPLPFYPWLRRLAGLKMADVYRRHLTAGRRTVSREQPGGLPDESAQELAGRLAGVASGPVSRVGRREQNAKVRAAVDRLPERDREVLVLRSSVNADAHQCCAIIRRHSRIRRCKVRSCPCGNRSG